MSEFWQPFVAPEVWPPVPVEISRRQFAHGLWRQNVITLDEAEAFLAVGAMPADLGDLVAALPTDQRGDARLLLLGASVFLRSHPTTLAMSVAFGWTDEVTDEFWRYAAEL